jgi:hypothetical protein
MPSDVTAWPSAIVVRAIAAKGRTMKRARADERADPDFRIVLVRAAEPTSTSQGNPLGSARSMEAGSINELLDAAVERPALQQLQVEIGSTLEDRFHPGLTGDDRKDRHLHAVDQAGGH